MQCNLLKITQLDTLKLTSSQHKNRHTMRINLPPALCTTPQCLTAIKLCLCAVLLGAASLNTALAQSFIESSPRPGGIAIIDLGPASADALPTASWSNREVAVFYSNDHAVAAVGIPLSVEPGTQKLTVNSGTQDARVISFDVEDFAYDEQRLVIENKRKVNPAPLDMERINKESERLNSVKNTRTEKLLANDFIWPVAGPISSPFGLRRFFNDQPRSPHGGIDIAAPVGTPIVAAADGVVLDADDYFFNGNSVFIEHGLGLQTFYAHMSRIDVTAGEQVKQGQVIGAVGATGRVTGPHLHWSVGLNATWIDPLLVMDTEQPSPAPASK